MKNIFNNHNKFEFSLGAIIKGGWKACVNNLGATLVISLIALALTLAPSVAFLLSNKIDIRDVNDWLFMAELTPLYVGVATIVFLVGTMLSVLVSNFTLTAMSKQKVPFSAFIPKAQKFKKALVVYFLWGIPFFILGVIPNPDSESAFILFAPVLLFAILAYFLIRYAFAWFVILDKDTSIGEALNKSSELTAGVKLQLLLIIVVLAVGIFALSVVTLGIGLLILLGFVEFAYAYTYKALQNRKT